LHGIQTGAGDKAEIASIGRELTGDRQPHNTVKPPRTCPFEKTFPLAANALGINDIVSAPILHQHFKDKLRGVLQIRIHQDNDITKGVIHTGRRGRLMAEVPGKRNDSYSIVFLCPLLQLNRRPIRASVIDQDQFDIRFNLPNDGTDTISEEADGFLFVETGNHDGNKAGNRPP
jgi:hypothetical protein